MTITINAQGSERKRLVQCISQWLGCEPNYLGAPSFAYQVDYLTIEKSGSLTFDDAADSEVIERLLQHIYDEGFDIDQSHTQDDAPTQVCISLPRSRFTDSSLENLRAILTAKGGLIQKALGVRSLPIAVTEEKVSFPWFSGGSDTDTLQAYTQFIEALCKMSANQKRVRAREKAVDNEKYAFRCFLLRLGFIGDEYKQTRKILLRNLTGSSAFKDRQPKEVESCE